MVHEALLVLSSVNENDYMKFRNLEKLIELASLGVDFESLCSLEDCIKS